MSFDRRGAPMTRGLGTATLIPRGFGGDAHEAGVEIRVETDLLLVLTQRSGLERRVTFKTEAVVAVEARSLLVMEGGNPWRSF